MNVRRLNDSGVDQFRHYLAALRADASRPFPQELIDDGRFTEQIDYEAVVEQATFTSKFECGNYLVKALSKVPGSALRVDTGMWAWLSGFYFDQLCPPDSNGRRRPFQGNERYIPSPGDHRYGLDKHFLFFPWKMRMIHGEAARSVLSAPLPKDSDEQRAWTGYYLNVCQQLVDAYKLLYWDEATQQIKRGALSHSKKSKGTLRRFIQLIKQLEVTYDIYGMASDEIIQLLPRSEFGKWIEA